jgi:hypothetical protein
MPKNLVWTQPQVDLNVTITSQVVVYAPAEKAEKTPSVSLIPLSPLWLQAKSNKKRTPGNIIFFLF